MNLNAHLWSKIQNIFYLDEDRGRGETLMSCQFQDAIVFLRLVINLKGVENVE